MLYYKMKTTYKGDIMEKAFNQEFVKDLIRIANNNDKIVDLYENYNEIITLDSFYGNYNESLSRIEEIAQMSENKIDLKIHVNFLQNYLSENVMLHKFNEEIAHENVNNLTGTPLFYNEDTGMCLTYKGLPDGCDEYKIIYEDGTEGEIVRACHHDLLGQLHRSYMCYQDTFKYRMLLDMMGYVSAYPDTINYKDGIYYFYTLRGGCEAVPLTIDMKEFTNDIIEEFN